MMRRSFEVFLPIGAAGLVAGLPVFFIACDYFFIDKTKLVTAGFISIWIILGALGGLNRRTAIFRQPIICIPYLAFLSLYYVNLAMWPKGTELDELMWAYSVAHAIVPFVLGSLFNRRDLRVFFLVVTLWGIALAGIVLAGYTSSEEAGLEVSRFTIGESLNPIKQSFVIGFAILVLYAQALAKNRRYPFLILPPLVLALLLGGSRGPAISLVVTLVVLTVSSRSASRKVLIILILALGFSGAVVFLPEAVLGRYFSKERWLTTQTEEGIPLRADRALVALEQWIEYPIFGSGTSGNSQVYYSHNLVIQILMEMGIVGLAVFFCMLLPLLLYFFKQLRASHRTDWETSAFTAFLLYGFLEAQVSGTYMGLNLLWLSIGILTSWRRINANMVHKKAFAAPHLSPEELRV